MEEDLFVVTVDEQQGRVLRLAFIQTVSFGAACGSAVFFGSYLVAAVSPLAAGGVALTVSLVVMAGMAVMYRYRPPLIDPEEGEGEDVDDSASSEIGGGWTVGTFLVAAVGVTLIVAIGVIVRFFIPLGIIAGFWVVHNDAPLVRVMVAMGLCLLVLVGLEFGFEHPLSRRWGLSLDGPVRTRTDQCPPTAE